MALINCKECDKEFSDKAQACPNCGCPLENKQSNIVYNKTFTEECPIEIRGNEVYYYDNEEAFMPKTGRIAIFLLVIWNLYMLYLLFNLKDINFLLFFLMWVGVHKGIQLISKLYYWKKTGEKLEEKKKKELRIILDYFQKRFPIYTEMKSNFRIIEVVNAEYSSKSKTMFSIYMDAYKCKADAIVINSDTSSTNVKGNISSSGGRVYGNTSSIITHNIMATLVKIEE